MIILLHLSAIKDCESTNKLVVAQIVILVFFSI